MTFLPQVRFHKIGVDTYVETPQLLASLEMPDSVQVLGQSIDLTPLRRLVLEPVQAGVEQAGEMLRWASSPELDLPALEAGELYMLTTYLDGSLRISRDDSGGMFIMLKEL